MDAVLPWLAIFFAAVAVVCYSIKLLLDLGVIS